MTRRGAIGALAVTLALQVFTSLAATATAVLAPVIAADLGVSAALVGVFVGIIYVGSATASLFAGGFIARFGAIRVSQAGVVLCALALLGLCAGAAPPSIWSLLLVLAPIVLGLGYGPITPASSHVLVRTAPPSRMALTFSIKQTGVPAGAALAGAVLPGLALGLGWRTAFVVVALVGIAIAAGAEPSRPALDADRQPGAPLSIAGALTPLRLVLRSNALVELATAGFVYAAMQVCLLSFLVVYLTETLRFPLVAAGFALTVANIGGIVGRIAWGHVADRWVRPRRLLGTLGIAAGLCAFATATMSVNWPAAVVIAICAAFGATAIGWNGVQLAQVARHAPPGQAATVTGASGFVTFAGVVLGPPTFALLATLIASYRIGFAAFGCLSLACGLWLLVKTTQ
jgi:MFS family permease